MIEQSIFYKLRTTVHVSDLVGTRIYPIKLPQSPTFPAITLSLISAFRLRDTSGPMGVSVPRIQIDCWDDSYSGAKTLSNIVRITLDGFKGTINNETDIGGISLQGEWDFYEENIDIYRVILDFLVPHGESTAFSSGINVTFGGADVTFGGEDVVW